MEEIIEKLIRVRISNFPNNMHEAFHTENEGIYVAYNPDKLGISPFMTPFGTALGNEHVALGHIAKSPETARIAELDDKFDFTFAGMRNYTRSYLKYSNEPERHAAEDLMVVFDKYGNISLKPNHEELALSRSLLEELRRHPNEIMLINLTPWMDTHEIAARELANLLDKRTDDIAQQMTVSVKKARREVDKIYKQISDRIDAMINIHGKEYVPGFVNKYNAHAIEYRNKYAIHIGRIQDDKDKDYDEEE
jgi:hypothetical protein